MVALIEDANKPQQHKSNEWYTPARYIEAAREVMGGIDLDPASCDMANETVKAERYYSEEENGLMLPWHGNVWLNPPFSAEGLVNPLRFWVGKLLEEYAKGDASQAILLVTAGIERNWFQSLWQYPICFPDHQIIYSRLGDIPSHKRHGDCFVYLGTNEDKFIEIFSQFGTIAKRVSTPKPTISSLPLWENEYA
jgi:DNA N-6-adenine-methyltransferase (Dam)